MKTPVIIICFLLTINIINAQQSEFPLLSGEYLGQKTPGSMAELFAYDLLSAGFQEGRIVFSPDGAELIYELSIPSGKYFNDIKGLFGYGYTMYSSNQNTYWTLPSEFLYACGYKIEYPFFSPDGNKIFFNSTGQRNVLLNTPSSRLWYIIRQDDGWSEPKAIDFGEGYQGRGAIYPSVAANGNLYFAQFPDGVHGFIYRSRYEDGKYVSPEILPEAINDQGANHPYIAPDESFMIFDSERNVTFGLSDLYISFRDMQGNWMKPINLGDNINSKYDERRAFLSYDRKYLFFVSDRISADKTNSPLTITDIKQLVDLPANGNRHIYWVDASFIEDLRKK
ncbi:MAG: hypothetical protein KKG99_07200 [Bacteroidetes bacterium]|nr:hypothetical protein [Bacteroidota bacterium]